MILIADVTCQLEKKRFFELADKAISFPIFLNKELYELPLFPTPEERENFRQLIANKDNMVSTSGLLYSDLEKLVKECPGEEIMLMTQAISKNSAATVEMLRIFKDDFKDVDILTYDSTHLVGGFGINLIETGKLVKAGKTRDEVVRQTTDNIKQTRHIGIMDDLFYLNRTGRIGMAKAVMGSAMKLTPICKATVEQPWVIKSVAKARTGKQIVQKTIDMMLDDIEELGGKSITTLVNYSGEEKTNAEILVEKLKNLEGINSTVELTTSSFPDLVHMGPSFLDVGYIIR